MARWFAEELCCVRLGRTKSAKSTLPGVFFAGMATGARRFYFLYEELHCQRYSLLGECASVREEGASSVVLDNKSTQNLFYTTSRKKMAKGVTKDCHSHVH